MGAGIHVLQTQAEGAAFIRISRVREIAGLSDDTLARWIKQGKFPAPVVEEKNRAGKKLTAGEKTTLRLWCLSEVMEWRRQQFAKRDERNAQQAASLEASA